MATTSAVAAAAIKTLFEGDGAHAQMRDFNPTLKLFENTKDNIEGGNAIKFPLQKQFQQGLGARGETDDLPVPGKSNYIACDFWLKKLTFSVQITTTAWKQTKAKGKAAFVDLITEQGKDVMGGLYRDMNWQLFGDGSGLRQTVNGAVAGPATDVTVTLDGYKGMFEGMLVDIYAAGGALPIMEDVEVTSVDINNLAITLASIDQNIPDGAEIYRAGNKDKEIMGLGGFVSDLSGPATIQGITVADQPIWRANDLDNGGTSRDLSRNLMDIASKAGMGVDQRKPDQIICGLIQARKYANLTVINENYEKGKGEKITLDAGYEKLLYKSIPITEDPDCPDDRMYFLRTKGVLKMWNLGKPEFVFSPDSGKQMWYRLEGKPYFRADGEFFTEFGGYRRNNQTVLRDLNTAG